MSIEQIKERIRKFVIPREVIEAFTPNLLIEGKRIHYCYLCGKRSLRLTNKLITCTNVNCRMHKGIDVIGYCAMVQRLNPMKNEDLIELCDLIIHRLKLNNLPLFTRITIEDALNIQNKLKIYKAINNLSNMELIKDLEIDEKEFSYDQIKTALKYNPSVTSTQKIRVSEKVFMEFYQYLVDKHKKQLFDINMKLKDEMNRLFDTNNDFIYIGIDS